MYSLIGLSIGALIGLLIAFIKSNGERQNLRGRRGHKFDEDFGEDSEFHEDFVLSYEDFAALEDQPDMPLKTQADAQAESGVKESGVTGSGVKESGTQPIFVMASPETRGPGVVKIYASRKSLKAQGFALAILLVMVLWVMMIFYDGGDGADIGFILLIGAGLCAILSPLIGVVIYTGWRQRKAIRARKPVLEFTPEGLTCQSEICGAVQTILWPDVIRFAPVLPTIGLAVSVDIEHRAANGRGGRISSYSVNTVDLELVRFIELLELYTGLEAERV
jgi:hypothetical protein